MIAIPLTADATGAIFCDRSTTAVRQNRTWQCSARSRGRETGGIRFFRETVRRRRFARFHSRGIDVCGSGSKDEFIQVIGAALQ